MDLNAASQAQLAAFLLAQNAPPAPLVSEPTPSTTSSSPFDPIQALAAFQWGSVAPELNPTELDGWLQEQLNALTQLPPNPPLAHFPAPAQPHAFPPISSSRFHPYDRHTSKPPPPPERQRSWTSHPLPPPPQSIPFYSPPTVTQVRQPVLYPPDDSPQPIILSSAPTPRSIPTHSARASPTTRAESPPNDMNVDDPCLPPRPRQGEQQNRSITKRRRTRSVPSFPTFLSSSSKSLAVEGGGGGGGGQEFETPSSKTETLERLFDWLDTKRWNLSNLLTALSEPPPRRGAPPQSTTERARDHRTPTHRRRIRKFLNLDSSVGTDETERGGGESFEARLKRWKKERLRDRRDEENDDDEDSEKGADEIVRMWEEQGGLGRGETRTKMEDAVKELHLNGGRQGPIAGVAIRSVINRYHEAYNESQADIARLDAALSRPPSPHLSSAPREPEAWSGHLIVPPLQADLLSHWLMSPGRPNLQEERSKGSIEADHMRIYSSLSPLDLHARGAEICRAILSRDESTRSLFSQQWDSIHLFVQGPSIAPVDTAGFSRYDEYSLWHHALMCYLQLCVRYPAFKESKEAHVVISPDLPPPIHPTQLETSLIDRLLRSHWDYLRLYLLNEHGGLLRSAVRGFEGVKLSRFDLLSVVGDTIEVIEALKKSRDSSDRILPYDSSVSQVRNAWRQRAFWDPQASWVAWSAATTHFLELSALNKDWAQGVKDLPGIEGLLGGSSSKTAASQALR